MTETAAPRLRIGDVTVTKVVEAVVHPEAESLLPGSSNDYVRASREWLAPHFIDATDRLVISIHSFLIEADGRRFVVDTGVGWDLPDGFKHLATPGEKYLRDLDSAGFAPNSVDFVICTHLHVDHVGWNTRQQGEEWVPTFPNARYVLADDAVSAWRRSGGSGAHSHGNDRTVEPLLAAGVVDRITPDHVLTPSVRLVSTPGHTPGHISIEISSGDQRGLITGDASHHPVQWSQPHWASKADLDPEESTRTRRRLLDELVDTDTLILGTHYGGPVAGRLVTTPAGVRFVTAD
ncbi:MBL fold metallo-hydrolase [Microbacterium trichothecenolyticum]|uniref:Putative quorum-quenching lactonase YtnP n=1 Tax=Microbacterium trichothecenolyticum TaxID=69370 RepID=A0A0M2HDM3_MICTR|nr:MBL fold metallo-hydrolase [Microbacterium trichothecenolyticum]KJL42331.1 putative quorum-quenching lactonase YtnP [Microbacterium trichothecenolyticum]